MSRDLLQTIKSSSCFSTFSQSADASIGCVMAKGSYERKSCQQKTCAAINCSRTNNCQSAFVRSDSLSQQHDLVAGKSSHSSRKRFSPRVLAVFSVSPLAPRIYVAPPLVVFGPANLSNRTISAAETKRKQGRNIWCYSGESKEGNAQTSIMTWRTKRSCGSKVDI